MHWIFTILQILTTTEAFLFDLWSDNPLVLTDNSTDYTTCGVVPTSCQDSKYRTYDGSCNNLQFGYWGTPYTPYVRILPNSYSDGVSAFPKSVTGADLPNPRTISLSTYADVPVQDKTWTLLFMQFGQLVAHDLSMVAGVGQTKNDTIVCCSKGQLTAAATTNKGCAPIEIPKDDPYAGGPEGYKCMDFYRTLSTHTAENCTNVTKVAEPLTAVTGFMDLSFIYGSDSKTANDVRAFKGGELASVMRNNRRVLPQDPDPEQVCNVQNNTETCYKTGDGRVNQSPPLAILHNLYMCQHNNIANAFGLVNPHWTDETIYQETRRANIGIFQNIVYYQFLPVLIGSTNMILNKLIYPNAIGYIRDYDPKVNPGMSIEAATAALRQFHTEVQGTINLVQEDRETRNNIRLSDWFDKPSVCEQENNFNELTIGMATQPQNKVDRFMPNEILNLLFGDGLHGDDLKAIDIWRGRDHGMCTYVPALEKCGFSHPKSFDDFKFMKPEHVDILKKLYLNYKDVELSVAVTLETLTADSLSGPTVQCILTDLFKRLRVGDRCFYENGEGKCAFTPAQLKEIRRHTIAGLMCCNPDIKMMQREAFKLLSVLNPLTSCDNIPKFNPEAWKE